MPPRQSGDGDDALASAQGTLVDRLAHDIHAAIMVGEYPLGSRLRQDALAKRFGVSRTPIREALRKLQSSELVEVVPNQGAIVRGPTPTAIREAYLVRAELEGLAAELAVPLISNDELLELRAAEQEFRSAVREFAAIQPQRSIDSDEGALDTAWIHANDVFHEVVLRASRNERLRKTIADLHLLFPRSLTWSALSARPELLTENVEEHARIRVAIERREGSTARILMTYHVHRAGELVAQWFEHQAT